MRPARARNFAVSIARPLIGGTTRMALFKIRSSLLKNFAPGKKVAKLKKKISLL